MNAWRIDRVKTLLNPSPAFSLPLSPALFEKQLPLLYYNRDLFFLATDLPLSSFLSLLHVLRYLSASIGEKDEWTKIEIASYSLLLQSFKDRYPTFADDPDRIRDTLDFDVFYSLPVAEEFKQTWITKLNLTHFTPMENATALLADRRAVAWKGYAFFKATNLYDVLAILFNERIREFMKRMTSTRIIEDPYLGTHRAVTDMTTELDFLSREHLEIYRSFKESVRNRPRSPLLVVKNKKADWRTVIQRLPACGRNLLARMQQSSSSGNHKPRFLFEVMVKHAGAEKKDVLAFLTKYDPRNAVLERELDRTYSIKTAAPRCDTMNQLRVCPYASSTRQFDCTCDFLAKFPTNNTQDIEDIGILTTGSFIKHAIKNESRVQCSQKSGAIPPSF